MPRRDMEALYDMLHGNTAMLHSHDSKAALRRAAGFTLIELLVVIAIIGILSAVILTSLDSARVKARDAQRQSEMKEVQNAFELYATDNGKYPAAPASGTWLADVAGLAPEYIASIPMDPLSATPKTKNDYHYWTDTGRVTGYTLLMYDEVAAEWCRYTVGDVVPTSWETYPLCESI